MTAAAPFFTVFTPTYNRAHTLRRVYESLIAQSYQEFEWLIVDDGSTDGTAALVDRWRQHAPFPIRYTVQPNQGKHIAFNTAIRDAGGRFLVPLDSDDSCVPHALERLRAAWDALSLERQERLAGITCRCMDEHGRLVGPPFPFREFESDARELYYRHRFASELWGAARVDVLREFAFDDSVRGSYVPEGTLWFRIAERYRGWYVDEPLRIYHQDEPSIMRGSAASRHAAGARLATRTVLERDLMFFRDAPLELLKQAGLYIRFSLHERVPVARQLRELPPGGARALAIAMLPAGALLYVRDRLAER